MVGLGTFAIVFASFCFSVLFILAGVDPKLVGNLWMLIAVLVSSTGSLFGLNTALAKRTTKWELTVTMCFALIVNSIMLLFAFFGLGSFAFEVWKTAA